jgi:hypothetical protein
MIRRHCEVAAVPWSDWRRPMLVPRRAALVSDPSLAEDLEFQQWYQPMKKAAAAELQQYESYTQSAAESRNNPRHGFRWGMGLDVRGVTSRGS